MKITISDKGKTLYARELGIPETRVLAELNSILKDVERAQEAIAAMEVPSNDEVVSHISNPLFTYIPEQMLVILQKTAESVKLLDVFNNIEDEAGGYPVIFDLIDQISIADSTTNKWQERIMKDVVSTDIYFCWNIKDMPQIDIQIMLARICKVFNEYNPSIHLNRYMVYDVEEEKTMIAEQLNAIILSCKQLRNKARVFASLVSNDF